MKRWQRIINKVKNSRGQVSKPHAAELAAAAGQWPEAEHLWQAEVDSGHPTARAWIGLSAALRKQGRFGRAETVISEARRKFPSHTGVWIESAEIAHSQSDWPEAIKRWRLVIKKFNDPSKLAPVYIRLSQAYSRASRYDEAEEIAKEGLKHHPHNLDVLSAFAQAAYERGDWSVAVERWRNVVSHDNAPAGSWARLNEALRKAGLTKEAQDVLKTGLALHPNYYELLVGAAEMANETEDWPKAVRCWQAAVKQINPNAKIPLWLKLYARTNASLARRLANLPEYKKQIARHKRPVKRKIAIYTSLQNLSDKKDYDDLKLPEVIDPTFDYFIFTDEPVNGLGIYRVKPLNQPRYKRDGSRATRYPKTHPHVLFKDYDVAIWIDTSIMVVGDLKPLIKRFLDSGQPIGNGTHPQRQSLSEEIEACIDLKKDDPTVLKRQLKFYQDRGFDTKDLANNGILFFNIHHPKLEPVMETWWQQIQKFSKRDQLSFNYSLYKNGADRFRLTTPPEDIRNHPLFIFTPHHTNNPLLKKLYGLLAK